MEYRQELGLGTKLKTYLGMEADAKYDEHQKKLVQNVKYCTDSQWQWVNSYYDGDKESSWGFFEDARRVYDTIYEESGTDIFRPGYQHWGKDAEAYLKDTRYAGKKFKDMIVLYYTAKLYEEAVDEIEFDMEQQKKVLNQLMEIKSEIGG